MTAAARRRTVASTAGGSVRASVVRAAEIRAALELHHPEAEGEWTVLHEWNHIDTLALRAYTGRQGCEVLAYEIKCSASDFRGELARPDKRRYAVELADAYYFVMPWPLAQKMRDEVPLGCGLLGVIADTADRTTGPATVRRILRADHRPGRPFTRCEVARLLRHRTHPPALRHALLERSERNQEMRKLRARHEECLRALGELAAPLCTPGASLAPPWSTRGVEVVGSPFLRRGRLYVRVQDWMSQAHDQDLGQLFAMGYRVVAVSGSGSDSGSVSTLPSATPEPLTEPASNASGGQARAVGGGSGAVGPSAERDLPMSHPQYDWGPA